MKIIISLNICFRCLRISISSRIGGSLTWNGREKKKRGYVGDKWILRRAPLWHCHTFAFYPACDDGGVWIFLLGNTAQTQNLGPHTHWLRISMSETYKSFPLSSPSDDAADFLWACTENPMSRLSTSCQFWPPADWYVYRVSQCLKKIRWTETMSGGSREETKRSQKEG